ncbi:MAG TPA: molybdopterin cofactor-binding domain-containing protein [Sporichthyaceae bacterium]|nr:molybdopterin cofactor-binding domain-containing protein [Sporichthyaceae bacterium]
MSRTTEVFDTADTADTADADDVGVSRRRFVGYAMAGATLIVAGRYVVDVPPAAAAGAAAGGAPIPSNDLPADHYDFMDFMRDQTRPVTPLLTLEVTPDGRVHFDMPRCEVGQGLETGVAQVIADQLEIPYEHVDITMSKARVDMCDSQVTGGSTSLAALWQPLRALSELTRRRLIGAAAKQWNLSAHQLRTKGDGYVYGPDGQRAGYGEIAIPVGAEDEMIGELFDSALGPPKRGVIGKSVPRKDLLAAVTGAKKFAMDLEIPGALPTMLCRPPQFNGRVDKVKNLDKVKQMPGVTDVGVIDATHRSSAVAVRANTFGQCIDAIRALDVDWLVGDTGKVDFDGLMSDLEAAKLPLPPAPPGAEVFEHTYRFQFRGNSPLETNCAVGDFREDRLEVWTAAKIPGAILAQLSDEFGLPLDKVIVNVVYAGGSFGRKLHGDQVLEAARASKLFGKPVRLMWHRTDDIRHGRQHPGAVSHIRATKVGNSITSYTHMHTSSAMDVTHSAGDVISPVMMRKDPSRYWGNTAVTMYLYQILTQVPYNFGPTQSALNEVHHYDFLPTAAVRNVYSPDLAASRELFVEELAEAFGMDGYEFRRAFARSPDMVVALDAVAKRGEWGRSMPAGMFQSIACHVEYKGHMACLMEIDNRPATVEPRLRNGLPGPRITKAIAAISMGIPVNPDQVRAQLMGGVLDGTAAAMSEGLHWMDGLPLEGGWDDYGWVRQWTVPPETDFILLDNGAVAPSGAGEVGVAAGYGAAAVAMQKALGRKITEFPANFRDPLSFRPIPKVPSVPMSPTRVLPV